MFSSTLYQVQGLAQVSIHSHLTTRLPGWGYNISVLQVRS